MLIKKEKGITLIALVITIIILLILAGISIAMLTGDNGILTKANNSKIETRGAKVQEVRDLWKINQEADKYTEDRTNQTLQDILNDLENERLITAEEKRIIQETGEVKIGSKTIVFEEKYLTDYLKIGDYVDYHPDTNVPATYDKLGETYSGYANGNIGQDNTLQWRILNINENTVDLISDKESTKIIFFKGARGYNNGVAILNDYCKTMYSNTSQGAVARSINVEDIQDKMKVDEKTGKKAYENYSSQIGVLYKSTYSCSSNKWYPLQWKKDKGVEGESEPKKTESSDIVSGSEVDAKAEETTGNLIVTQTYWTLNSSEMNSNFETADTRDPTKSTSMYYELFINNGNTYWLASRCTYVAASTRVFYGLRYMNSGVSGNHIFDSEGRITAASSDKIRPVVSLPSNIIDLNTNYESVGKWNLKNIY